jgi:hypothetical protein
VRKWKLNSHLTDKQLKGMYLFIKELLTF